MSRKEVYSIGDTVRVDFLPGCPAETHWHGIRPVVNGREGVIQGIRRDDKSDHPYIVRFDGWLYKDIGFGGNLANTPIHQYFAASELLLVKESTNDHPKGTSSHA